MASDGYDSVYEYALIDDENNSIKYVLLSYPGDLVNSVGLIGHMDCLKKDKGAYIIKPGSAIERFSLGLSLTKKQSSA